MPTHMAGVWGARAPGAAGACAWHGQSRLRVACHPPPFRDSRACRKLHGRRHLPDVLATPSWQWMRRSERPTSAFTEGQSLLTSEETEDLTPADAEVVPLDTPDNLAVDERFSKITVFVAGATGGTGRAIVNRLVLEGVPVKCLVRDFSAAAQLLPGTDRGVELYLGDVFQFSTLPSVMEGCNAVIVATGSKDRLNPFGPYNIDYQGTANIVAAAKLKGIERVILVSSIGTDDPFFPLNLFFGVLFFKKRAEEELQRSGLTYTIVRPGGLLDQPRQGQRPGNIIMAKPNTFGLPPRQTPGSILRSQVADVCVEALIIDEAANKVVEVIANDQAPAIPIATLFKYL